MITMERLVDILRESAGEDESVNLDGDVLDSPFTDLGYDSLALYNTVGRVEREYGIRLPEDLVSDSTTPRNLIDAVNGAVPSR
jgi:act minimal PKS acyl carrier protein